jgi:hypothetical protein
VNEADRAGAHEPASRVQARLDRERLRRLAIRVLIVQVVALAALWLLQSHFGAA